MICGKFSSLTANLRSPSFFQRQAGQRTALNCFNLYSQQYMPLNLAHWTIMQVKTWVKLDMYNNNDWRYVTDRMNQPRNHSEIVAFYTPCEVSYNHLLLFSDWVARRWADESWMIYPFTTRWPATAQRPARQERRRRRSLRETTRARSECLSSIKHTSHSEEPTHARTHTQCCGVCAYVGVHVMYACMYAWMYVCTEYVCAAAGV